MGELKRESVLCFTCNSDVSSGEFHAVFYTFLRANGTLLADAIIKYLLLNDVAALGIESPVICNTCCNLIEDLCESSDKACRLREEIWTLYKSSVLCRSQDITNVIRGVAVQTDTDFELDFDNEGECNDDQDTVDDEYNCRVDFESNEEKWVDENGAEHNPVKELITIDVDVDPQPNNTEDEEKWPRWKRRPVCCKLCGRWFKTKVALQEHQLAHKDARENNIQDNASVLPSEKKTRKSQSADKKRSSSDVKHQIKSLKGPCIYVCRVCGKELKSKTGAIYHAKSHAFQVSKNFELDEVFDLKHFPESGDDGNASSVPAEENQSLLIIQSDMASSSEDELPLSKRRNEFKIEKNKQDVHSESEIGMERGTTPRKALQTLRKYGDIQVTKLLGAKSLNGSDGEILDEEHLSVQEETGFETVDENMVDDELRSKISDLTRMNELTIKKESDIKAEAGDPRYLPGLNKRGRGRRKITPLRALLKIKERKKLLAPKEPRFKCDICGKLWKTKGELNSHRSTHSDERPYICEICGQAYKHKPALDVHVGMHRGIYQHQCPYCKKAFTQKGALQRHLPIHTGDLPFQCELCGKRFVHRTSFSIHTMAHTGVRNIRCEVCNMGVLSKSHLRRHMRIHSGEKPYECGTCGKAFAERYNLVAHQRIHDPTSAAHARTQKRKPQSCRLCNAIFDRRTKLEDHMVSAHNKVVESPPQQIQTTRAKAYDNNEAFLPPRFLLNETATSSKSDSQTSTNNVKRDEQPSVDLSMRGVHGFRNIDILRSTFDSTRGLELIRMANGIVDPSHPWNYINPSS